MKIDILCSNPEHPVVPVMKDWAKRYAQLGHDVLLIYSKKECRGGDVLFLISCTEIVRPEDRSKYTHSLVIHGSDLPMGRGWSPVLWGVGLGQNHHVISLLNVADPFDTGEIWKKESIDFRGDELYDEINARLFECEASLMSWFVDNGLTAIPVPQTGESSYWPRRTDEQNCLDVNRTLAEQFDQMRVCDPHRFPAFFDFRGTRYYVRLEKDPSKLIKG